MWRNVRSASNTALRDTSGRRCVRTADVRADIGKRSRSTVAAAKKCDARRRRRPPGRLPKGTKPPPISKRRKTRRRPTPPKGKDKIKGKDKKKETQKKSPRKEGRRGEGRGRCSCRPGPADRRSRPALRHEELQGGNQAGQGSERSPRRPQRADPGSTHDGRTRRVRRTSPVSIPRHSPRSSPRSRGRPVVVNAQRMLKMVGDTESIRMAQAIATIEAAENEKKAADTEFAGAKAEYDLVTPTSELRDSPGAGGRRTSRSRSHRVLQDVSSSRLLFQAGGQQQDDSHLQRRDALRPEPSHCAREELEQPLLEPRDDGVRRPSDHPERHRPVDRDARGTASLTEHRGASRCPHVLGSQPRGDFAR